MFKTPLLAAALLTAIVIPAAAQSYDRNPGRGAAAATLGSVVSDRVGSLRMSGAYAQAPAAEYDRRMWGPVMTPNADEALFERAKGHFE